MEKCGTNPVKPNGWDPEFDIRLGNNHVVARNQTTTINTGSGFKHNSYCTYIITRDHKYWGLTITPLNIIAFDIYFRRSAGKTFKDTVTDTKWTSGLLQVNYPNISENEYIFMTVRGVSAGAYL